MVSGVVIIAMLLFALRRPKDLNEHCNLLKNPIYLARETISQFLTKEPHLYFDDTGRDHRSPPNTAWPRTSVMMRVMPALCFEVAHPGPHKGAEAPRCACAPRTPVTKPQRSAVWLMIGNAEVSACRFLKQFSKVACPIHYTHNQNPIAIYDVKDKPSLNHKAPRPCPNFGAGNA